MTNDEMDLINNNINLAYKVAWDYNIKLSGCVDLEELQSLCFLGLVKASRTFDRTKNFEFSTYAYTVMRNEIIHYFNKFKKHTQDLSLSQEISDDRYLEDILSDNFNVEDEAAKNIKIELLYKFINELDDFDKSILMYSLNGLTNKQIGLKLGKSEAYIGDKYRKAINKLRYKFYRNIGGDNEWE